MNFAVKIHINKGTISEFLMMNTDLNLKELIPRAVVSYIEGKGNERLITNKIQLNEKKDNLSEYITIKLDSSNSKTTEFLNGIEKNKVSTICRSIFEAKFASEHYTFLVENRCFIPATIEAEPEVTFESVITAIENGEKFKTTVKEFLQLCKQQKRTDKFVRDTYKRIGNAGGIIATLNGELIAEEVFKIMDTNSEIIVLRKTEP